MGRFYGIIGYAEQIQTSPGVWEELITERTYSGDVIKNMSRMKDGDNLNDNLAIDNRFSIVADPYAYAKFHTMRYIRWMGSLWKINSVDVQRPRLILTIGGVYNAQQTPATE